MSVELIITVCGFILTIVGVIIGFTRQYTRLESIVDNLKASFDAHKADNEKNRVADKSEYEKNRVADVEYLKEQDSSIRSYLMEGMKDIKDIVKNLDGIIQKNNENTYNIIQKNHENVKETVGELKTQVAVLMELNKK